MNRTKVKNNHPPRNESDSGDESNSSSRNNQLDLSLLRKPVKTSIQGFEEVLRAYESGTNEIKKLLSKECDLIYECKVCRNIFRSLTNFISHKRVYCRSSFNSSNHFHFNSNGFTVQDVSAIIQSEQKSSSNNNSDIKHTTGMLNSSSGSGGGAEDKSKDLSGIVEQILWKQHQSRNSNVNDFYNQNQASDSSSLARRKSQTLLLNRVNDSDVAVFQSILTDNDNSNMKDEINEVHKMISKNSNCTILGPDGKIINLFNSKVDDSSALLSTDGNSPPTCQVCNLQFETQKMLKVHLEIKHSPSSYVYQCPSCSQCFSSSAAVIRHLSNDHKKSNRRIRLLRDSIINKRMRADEVINKNTPSTSSSSRELQKLQKQLNNGIDEISEWNEIDLKGGGSLDDSYTCPSCLKKFERKAVYTSHVQMCSDSKDREIEKSKKRKAKDVTKVMKNVLAIEEDSNLSETQQQTSDVNKRKRKRTSKVKNQDNNVIKIEAEKEQKQEDEEPMEDSNDIVDWNLDDEEEKKKIENIKKEIIAEDYKKIESKLEPVVNEEMQQQHPADDDDEDSGLIIDEKVEVIKEEKREGEENFIYKCPQCDKSFETNEKLKTHLTCYHSRQKRFRCKICDYQGYRKKDTLNHLNFVHNCGATLEHFFQYVETVNKAVDEADILKQKEIKRGQTKLKRQLARQMQRQKVKDGKSESDETSFKSPGSSSPAPEGIKVIAKPSSTPVVNTPLSSPPMQISPNKSELKSTSSDGDDEEESFSEHQRRKSTSRSCKNTFTTSNSNSNDISPTTESNQRPIRTRVKPVNKDFLYDLSDLLKKEQEAHREQIYQTANISANGGKRELRKRAMSIHSSRESFESPSKQQDLESPSPKFLLPTKVNEITPPKNRRMSVFVQSSRPMYPTSLPPPPLPPQPLYSKSSPVASKQTHKNAGMALKMAKKASEENRASLCEQKFFEALPNYAPRMSYDFTSMLSSDSASTSNNSAASSILQKLSGGGQQKQSMSSKLSSADQLCRKFQHFNVTNELASSSSENNLMTLALSEAKNDNVCVLQECSADSTEFNNGDSDSEPRLEIHSKEEEEGDGDKQVVKKGRGRPRKSGNNKTSTKNQQRLTVMQRLQENKIKKSREQIFQRLLKRQSEEDDDDDDYEEEDGEFNDSDSSPDFDLSGC